MTDHAAAIAANDASRARLRALVQRLTDADLARDLGSGWNVATMLAHLGFYDARVISLLRRYAAGGPVEDSPLDPDAINEAKLPFFQLLPPRAAADLTLALANACDAAVAQVTPELAQRLAAAGHPARLDRAHHRLQHIEQIEQALAAGQ